MAWSENFTQQWRIKRDFKRYPVCSRLFWQGEVGYASQAGENSPTPCPPEAPQPSICRANSPFPDLVAGNQSYHL